MKTFRASVVQTLARLGDLDENIRILRVRTAEAVGQGASLVVFPECMNTGYLFDSRAHCLELAERTDGRYAQAMSQLAREHGVFIASGFTERVDDRAFNSGLLFDPRGELILRYQKQFLATHDQNWFEVGGVGCPVVETELGKIGLLICFDGRIPEIARCLALQGAQVICDMANFFTMDQADLLGAGARLRERRLDRGRHQGGSRAQHLLSRRQSDRRSDRHRARARRQRHARRRDRRYPARVRPGQALASRRRPTGRSPPGCLPAAALRRSSRPR